MALERASSATSLVDVLDRVLDKGIVIDAFVRVSLVGIELVTVEARVVVASIATYLDYADTLAEARVGAQVSSTPVASTQRRRNVPLFGANGRPRQ